LKRTEGRLPERATQRGIKPWDAKHGAITRAYVPLFKKKKMSHHEPEEIGKGKKTGDGGRGKKVNTENSLTLSKFG